MIHKNCHSIFDGLLKTLSILALIRIRYLMRFSSQFIQTKINLFLKILKVANEVIDETFEMHSKLIVFLFCTCWMIILLNGPQHVEANFFDDINSFYQDQSADAKRAKEAEKKFVKQINGIISNIKSYGEQIVDELEDATKSPKSFYEKILEPALDYTPIVGHIKSEIHQVMGNGKKAKETLDKANALPNEYMRFAGHLIKLIQHFFE